MGARPDWMPFRQLLVVDKHLVHGDRKFMLEKGPHVDEGHAGKGMYGDEEPVITQPSWVLNR